MQRPNDSNDYRRIFLYDVPILDTRAPLEFARGAFPCAVNVPLMNDEEREQVGRCYKASGQQAALELGHQLVRGSVKDQRVAAWKNFVAEHPQGYLYCFRGGLRSKISQQWLAESGATYPLIKGGYKAMRRFLIDELDRSVEKTSFCLVCGATGSGKTRVIDVLADAVDLEGLANHRGSAFGHLIVDQPTQINFENKLSIELMKKIADGYTDSIYLEDEGHLIGKVALPEKLRVKMSSAPMLIIDEDFESRLDILVEDYVVDLSERFVAAFGGEGVQKHRQKLLDDLSRIKKRLGSERYLKTAGLINQAFSEQADSGLLEGHRRWIEVLLGEYYDPMYEYQLGRRQGKVLARGNRQDIVNWIRSQ